MARPPEPLEDVIDEVSLAITGRVIQIFGSAPGRAARANEAPSQLVEIEVERVLHDAEKIRTAGSTLTAMKPPGDYALAEGHHGPFLLKRSGEGLEILGRYGPDTYPLAAIIAALEP